MKSEGEYRDYVEDMLEATDKVAFIAGMTERSFWPTTDQFAVAPRILGRRRRRCPIFG
jgi:hypothetical protein